MVAAPVTSGRAMPISPRPARQTPARRFPNGVMPTTSGARAGEPQNILSGLINGTRGLATGVGLGVAAGVSAPVLGTFNGAKSGGVAGGVAGALVGTAAGLVVASVGVIGGVGSAAVNVVTGTINTPFTVAAMVKDDDLYAKTPINLAAEGAKLTDEYQGRDGLANGDLKGSSADLYKPTMGVRETRLYDALAVMPNATSTEIRKAYHQAALREHPDKGGDSNRFQTVGFAYQMLSNPRTRRQYDNFGEEGLRDQPYMSAAELFATLLGEGKFDHLVGRLSIVTHDRLRNSNGGLNADAMHAKLKELQREREIILARTLAKRLETWVQGDEEKFIQDAADECKELSSVHLGPQMLRSIGIQYEIAGNDALAFKGRNLFCQSADMRRTQVFAKALVGMLDVAREQGDLDSKTKGMNEDGKAKAMGMFAEKVKLSIFDLMAGDIEASVAAAVSMCCSDTSEGVDKDVRRKRAQGIIKLGIIFQGKHNKKLNGLLRRTKTAVGSSSSERGSQASTGDASATGHGVNQN